LPERATQYNPALCRACRGVHPRNPCAEPPPGAIRAGARRARDCHRNKEPA
jgi:hypothetical protein